MLAGTSARRRAVGRRPIPPLAAALVAALALFAACGAPAPTPPTPPPAPPVLPLPAVLAGDHLFVSDLVTGDVAALGTATYHLGRSVHGLGLSADGRTLYASDIAADAVLALPIAGGRLGTPRRARVGVAPVHMLQSADGGAVYVTDFGESAVSVVDAATWTTTATIAVPANPHGLAPSPDGRLIYVACVNGGAVAIIDSATRLLAGTIALPAGARPYAIAVSSDGRYLYVPDNFAARLFVLDAASRQVIGAVPIGLRAALIARSADGATLYVTDGASGAVSVLDIGADPTRPRPREAVPVGTYPHGLALTPDGRYLVVANTLGDTLSVVATADGRVVATIPGERYPNDVLAAP